jgi:hypothetical protein
MVTMAAGEPPLTGADSPLTSSAHQGPGSSLPRLVARPGDLTPPRRQSKVYVGPCRAIGQDGTGLEALHPHLTVVAHGSAWAAALSEKA